MKRHIIAVYGTIKKGGRLHSVLELTDEVNFISSGFFYGDLYTNGSFPAVVDGNGKVICELYEVDPYTLGTLDYYESNGFLYNRKITEVFTEEGKKPIFAWVYFYINEEELQSKFYFWDKMKKNVKGEYNFLNK